MRGLAALVVLLLLLLAGCGPTGDGEAVAVVGSIEATAPFGDGFARSAIGDCDGDGIAEVVLGRRGAIEAWHVASDGTATPAMGFHVGAALGGTAVALGDLDGDGRLDLIAGGFETIDFYHGAGPCAFAAPVPLAHHAGISVQLQILDVDGDGHLDVLDAREDDEPVRVYLAPDWHEAPLPRAPKAGKVPTFGAALYDVDGDGNLDLFVLADHGFAWLAWGTGGARWQADDGDWTSSIADADAMGVAPIDFDGDGVNDYFISGTEGRSRLLRGGSRTFDDRANDAHCAGPAGAATWGAASHDLDGDGRPDILALTLVNNNGPAPNRPRVLLNLGGTFGHADLVSRRISATELACGALQPGTWGCVAGGVNTPALLLNHISARR